MIVIGGMIGLGKTTTADMISKELNIPVYYESVDDNKVLPLFYTASDEEIQRMRYPFLLQLNFLKTRFHAIKEALLKDDAVLDRSIYEDSYFAIKNYELGRISKLEIDLYLGLLDEMMQEISGMKKKAPDVMVYLKGSFDTVLKRIKQRGRSYELDDALVEYYRFLWKDYDNWLLNEYKASPVIIVDVDKEDIIFNEKDKVAFLEKLKKYLH
jgi:deoxyadenosine/deoxycytidine kinase